MLLTHTTPPPPTHIHTHTQLELGVHVQFFLHMTGFLQVVVKHVIQLLLCFKTLERAEF